MDVLSSAGPPGLLCRAVDTARPIRPSGQPRPAVISVLSIAYSFHSALFSTFLWPAALSSGQRRWRFPPFGTLPGAAFLPVPSTVSLDSYIFGSPLRRLRSCLRRLFHGIQNTTTQAQAPAAPLLRCRLSTFCFAFTAVLWHCRGHSLYSRAAFLRQDALASAKFQCTHPPLSCSLSYPQVLRDAARPAVRAPAAPCCRQTGVYLDSRGGRPKYKARPARRAWSAETIHAISSVHNDIKGKSYAIPSFPEDAVLCPFHALLQRALHHYSCVFSVEYFRLMVSTTVILFISPMWL